ncbi:hypothetical protein R5W23_002449 [Gemmata sp. JC673]|uniref:NolW-like domain-containing protein n=1 Tax=Gemmata algarum TaxID=2975278 RepID=A0ABU5F0T0_9BACT|nr:hypothetical protein [Gemmata algarum]MDY3561187.1 hypothetical protein [Gemmata algarum]
MSRLVWLVIACGLVLAPGFANDTKTLPKQNRAADLLAARLKQKVKIDGSKIGAKTLTEVLGEIGKSHDISFVLLENEFKSQQVVNIKDKVSAVKQLDTDGLTVAEFLGAWLPGLGATYQLRPDYVEVIPLRTARADVAPAKKGDPVEQLLATLANTEVDLENKNLNETPLFELLGFLSKKYSLVFAVNESAFKAEGFPNVREERPTVTTTALRGQSLHQHLSMVLESFGATYLVKNGVIEIVPVRHAAVVAKAPLDTSAISDTGGRPRLKEPLVSMVVKEKTLNDTVARLAETYDLTVIVSPQAGDAKLGLVSARMLNTPADRAIELLAVQCDLRVVRKGGVYLITSKEQASELFNEKLERERQKIELERLREAPAAPQPPAPKM